jgi:hypothetical protein
LFSFGSIKTASAVGGAILRVRDPGLLAKMRSVQERWPVQGRRHYAGRLCKALCLVVLGRPLPYGILAGICELIGRDLDDLVNGTLRVFPVSAEPNGALLGKIRRQPSAPLLALLARRLRYFDMTRLVRRTQSGERVARRLPASVHHPGWLAPTRTHWLFPVVVSDPGKLVSALRRRGFDASRVTSNIAPVPAPPDLPRLVLEDANRMMSHLVFLPVYPKLPEEALESLAGVVEEVAEVISARPEVEA